MEAISDDDIYTIALRTDYGSLKKLCKVSKRFLKLCMSPIFWLDKFQLEFGDTGEFYRIYNEIDSYEWAYIMAYVNSINLLNLPPWAKQIITNVLNVRDLYSYFIRIWAARIYNQIQGIRDIDGEVLVRLDNYDMRNHNVQFKLRFPGYARKCQFRHHLRILPYEKVLYFINLGRKVFKYILDNKVFFVACDRGLELKYKGEIKMPCCINKKGKKLSMIRN